mmetsp:Transcript_471/g.785  ORF Transcript_471/g.785 Transcript_471/m.785 type:complete len:574 (+) Transcript_471:11-1732(+)
MRRRSHNKEATTAVIDAPLFQPKKKSKSIAASQDTVKEEFSSSLENNGLVELSEYERTRLENIKRNEEYLSSLGLEDTKAELESIVAREHKATSRGASKKVKLTQQELTSRRSGRVTVEKLKAEIQDLVEKGGDADLIQQREIEMQELIAKRYDSSYAAILDSSMQSGAIKVVSDEPIMLKGWINKGEVIEDQEEKEMEFFKIISTFKSPKKKNVVTSVNEYQEMVRRLTLKEADVAKLTPSRITAVFLHPSTSKVLVAAGDKNGFAGLWNVDNFQDGNDGVLPYHLHNSNITRFNCFEEDSSRMYSASYDGTIRCLDVQVHAFLLAFVAPETRQDDNRGLYTSDCFFLDSHGSFGTASSCLVGKSDGSVGLVDLRASASSYQWDHPLQASKINSIQQHPTSSHLIVSAGSGKAGSICIHDVRKAGKSWKPLVEINEHSKSINAAVVSEDGHFCVSVSLDNTVRTWTNFTDPSVKPSCEVMRRDNHTGRWLCTFKPTFDPKFPSCFALGCMQKQRVVELFHIEQSPSKSAPSTRLLRQIGSDSLQSVCSRNAFHPHLNVIAGGNSSGRVHLFR